MQYYSALVTHVLGDSDKLCTTILRDIRSNTKLAPLLPYLATFLRQGMKKYPDKPHLTIRLLRLMSTLFSNPHINLSPKPSLPPGHCFPHNHPWPGGPVHLCGPHPLGLQHPLPGPHQVGHPCKPAEVPGI